jgi:c(7)-type cytochrome triheme protein
MQRVVIYSFMVLLALGLATAVVAQSLPRLPKAFDFPQSPDSPGIVTFNHDTHIAVQEKPDCTACHPKLFKILEPGMPVEGRPIRHGLLEKKRQCGACHDGEVATGLDQCDHCHKAS